MLIGLQDTSYFVIQLFCNVKQIGGRAESVPVASESVIMTNDVLERLKFCMRVDDKHEGGSVLSYLREHVLILYRSLNSWLEVSPASYGVTRTRTEET